MKNCNRYNALTLTLILMEDVIKKFAWSTFMVCLINLVRNQIRLSILSYIFGAGIVMSSVLLPNNEF